MKKTIWFSGGCFWGVEAYFNILKGVLRTEVGYAQGNGVLPTYEMVCQGKSGYTETVEIDYDNEAISLPTLLTHMFRFVDPTTLNKQGNDIGIQYRSGIYYLDDDDLPTIEDFLVYQSLNYDKPLVVEVEKLKNYFPAEDYHQDYLVKNPEGYCHINLNLVQASEKK